MRRAMLLLLLLSLVPSMAGAAVVAQSDIGALETVNDRLEDFERLLGQEIAEIDQSGSHHDWRCLDNVDRETATIHMWARQSQNLYGIDVLMQSPGDEKSVRDFIIRSDGYLASMIGSVRQRMASDAAICHDVRVATARAGDLSQILDQLDAAIGHVDAAATPPGKPAN